METEDRYNTKLENVEVLELRWMILEYVGFDSKYHNLKLEREIDICSQVWTFSPYLEDFDIEPPFE
ncbi:MAG: hypothetical protein AAF573_22140, partial [Bacteroidota bacterium]